MTFSSRFKDNARMGLRSFYWPNPWWVKAVMVIVLPIAPFFWAWGAFFYKDTQ
jgi:hypothetical protein